MSFKKIIMSLQVLCLMLLFLSFIHFDLFAASSVGLGDVEYTESRDIYDGVNLEYSVGFNNNDDQKAYTVEMKKGSLTALATYGEYVYGGEILSKMIKTAENKTGKKVVVAINGDFYDTSNGVPLGIMIVNGKLATLGTTAGSEAAVGIKADGSIIFGNPSISLSFNDGTNTHNIKYLNNDRKYDTNNLYLYTGDFGSSTKAYADGKEIVLSIESGSFELGGEVKAKVIATSTKDHQLSPNTIVLASGNTNDTRLNNLTIGKEITINITDNNPNAGWCDVVQSIGYPHLLAVDGKPTQVAIDDQAVHPRTAIGVKADGTIVLFQVDGRQPGWSNGLSFKQMVEWMCDVKGCKTVVNLDGGGSSTIMARQPGEEDATVLNSPSDGGERSNSNALLFLADEDADPNKEIAHLHAYPKNLSILAGGETKITIKATDKNYYPVEVPKNITFSTNSDLVSVDKDGNLTTKSTAGKAIVTASSGNIQEATTVEIVDTVTKITCDKTIISVAPNGECKLNITAFNGSMPLTASNSSFKWYLSSNTLGTINDGIFKGSSAGGTGTLTISFKSYSLQIPIEVGKLPVMISTFEDAVIGSNWHKKIEGSGGGKGEISVNTDERYVKFGNKSLRVDYDFRSATATTSVTAYQGNSYIKLEGYPTHIGMWVYGDNNGANIRIQIRDGNNAVQYISFNPDTVNWTGWKYIEAVIPSGLPTPIQIQFPIRVMSVGGKVKTNGTLYFDNFRAVYGFKNDDLKEPVLKDITPSNLSTTSNNQEKISVNVIDEKDENGNTTGINKDSIKMWINEEPISNLVMVDNTDGSITVNYTPSALSVLKPGPQIVKMRVEDNYGNITIKSWQFTLLGDYAGVSGITPDNDVIYAGDNVTYYVTTESYKNFEKVTGTLNFNHKALKVRSISLVDNNLKLIADKAADANKTGALNFEISGMDSNQISDGKLLKIIFTTVDSFVGGSDSEIVFTNVNVYEKGYSKPTKFMLPSYEVKVDYRYRISYITSTVGSDIEFIVTDDKLNPISGASFEISNQNIVNTVMTNNDGKAVLSCFKSLNVGDSFKIKAYKDNYYSENITVIIQDSLRSISPTNIFVSPGENASTSAYITWHTNLSTNGSMIKYREIGSNEWIIKSEGATTERVYVTTGSAKQEYLTHAICLDGLKENTKYEYQVGDGINDSQIYSFKTLSSDKIDIVFLGDPQNTSTTGYQITENVLKAGLETLPSASLVMYAGDIVDNVTMNSQWEAFNSVLGKYNNSYITACATGNHDVITSYAKPFKASLTPNQNMVETIGSSYYFEAGNALIVVIDTETVSMFDAQADFLKSLTAKSSKDFTIVLMHRSPYAANYDEPHIRDFWPKVFEEAGVDLVLSGHDHVYSSTQMLNGKINKDGITYVVGGTSGQKYYSANNIETRYWLDYVYDDDYPIFSTISINNEELVLNSYAYYGNQKHLINTIKLEPKVTGIKDIEINSSNDVASLLNNTTLVANVIDEAGENIGSAVSWSLKEQIKGVEISSNGQIIITNEIEETKKITVVASYKGFTKEFTIEVTLLTAMDVINDLNNAKKEYIEGLFK